ncbi:MAG: NAD(P)-dependent alcohol dehydrogenase [Saprospiraceae bacterium]
MKAAIHTQYGPPEVVQIQEVTKPSPSEHEVLIKIHATTVNRTDSGLRSAEYFISRFFTGLFRPKQQILGNEFAGEIEAVGAKVTKYSVGDRVFGFSEVKMGGHAEYMCMPETDTFTTLPTNLSYIEAAPICEGAHYALVDIRAAKVTAGQKVLVNGATGAIGSAAVQLLKYFGAQVTAVCDTKNVALIQSLGADRVIDYLKEDFTKEKTEYDFIFDAVGKSSFGKCKPNLSKNGIYISTELGKNAENIYLALLTPLFGGKRLLFPLPTITYEDVLFLKELVEKGNFKPLIDRQYKLDDIVEAYRFVETGQKTGNVVITVTES